MTVANESSIDEPPRAVFNHFLSKRQVARWMAKSETLTKAELRYVFEHTMPECERDLLLRDGEIILDFYEAPGVYTRMRMRGRRSKELRAEIVAVKRGLRAECD